MVERRTTTVMDVYAYPESAWSTMDLSRFSVEATDGGIGKVDEATNEVGSGFLVVDTGPWIFGKKVLIPAGTISRIDEQNQTIWVNLTKDEIQNAPELDESTFRDDVYRERVGTYYTGLNRPAGPDYGRSDRTDDRGF